MNGNTFKGTNVKAFKDLCVINGILAIAYIIEIFKGAVRIDYVLGFIATLAIVTLIAFIILKVVSVEKDNYGWIIAFLYLFECIYASLTARTYVTVVYCVPFYIVLLLYNNSLMSTIFSTASTIIAVITGISYYVNFPTSSMDITNIEILVLFNIVCTYFTMKFSKQNEEDNIRLLLAEENSKRDALTGCFNRGFLETLISSVSRTNSLTLMLIDINDFKKFNDNFGHDTGDLVLIQFARVLLEVANEHKSYPIRLGGDEFLLVCPLMESPLIKEKIKNRVSVNQFLQTEKYNVKVSIGCARTTVAPEVYAEVYKEADDNMYEDKATTKKISLAEARSGVR